MKDDWTEEILGGWPLVGALSSIGKIEYWVFALKLLIPTFAFFLFALGMKGGI